MDDNELIKLIAKGKKQYAEEIRSRYEEKVTKRVKYLVYKKGSKNHSRSPTDHNISDIVDNCFSKVLKKARIIHHAINVKEKRPFRTYFMRYNKGIVNNTIRNFKRDYYNKEIKKKVKLEYADNIATQDYIEENQTQEIEQVRIQKKLLRNNIKKLKKIYRIILRLRYLVSKKGLSYKEIAKRLNIPIETVRTRIKRGIKKLKKLY